jgi:hypothetical protein
LGELGDPRQKFQGALHVFSGDGAGVLSGGFFQGALGQMVEQARQSMAGLHE